MIFIVANKQLTLQSSFLLVKPVIPVGPKRLLHPDPVPTEVARFPVRGVPVDLPPEGGVVRGVGGQQRARAREERAIHRRRLGAEDEGIVAEQPSFAIMIPNMPTVEMSNAITIFKSDSRSKYNNKSKCWRVTLGLLGDTGDVKQTFDC